MLACLFFSSHVWSKDIRVLLSSSSGGTLLKVRGPFYVENKSGSVILKKRKSYQGKLGILNNSILWGRFNFKSPLIKIIPRRNASIYWNQKRLKGKVVLSLKGDKLRFINILNLEDYLKGVLPREMPFWWPFQALKAQAVVARTYALYKMQENKDKDFDILATTLSQVYGGKSSQRYKTDLAVDFTHRQVLLCGGKLFPAYYHACCGGVLESGKYFDKDVSCLVSKKDPYCQGTRFYRWRRRISKNYLISKLMARGYFLRDILSIKIRERTPSGRVRVLEIEKETHSKFKLLSQDLRVFLGHNILLSNLYEVYIRGGYIYFEGRGWGHGVGMCQWGAYSMAKKGKSYKEILNFYYPGSKLSRYGY